MDAPLPGYPSSPAGPTAAEGSDLEAGTGAAGWPRTPTLPPHYVRRPRLLSLLDEADARPLVLVSAPAGSGKTSLVADWCEARARHDDTAWVTFEPEDEALWPAVVGSLARLGVAVPSTAPPADATALDRGLLAAVASAVATHPTRLTVVIDGYEVVSAEVGRDLDFLLRHSGHRLQLVVLTRADPVLPLYRYRLEGTVAEVRRADLSFTDDEAALLLRTCGISLTPASVHSLNTRTEGWAVGLRFAATFLEHREDAEAAVEEVAGDTGNIGEYLLGEVLDAQTAEVRELLLSTSIPETLRPGLTEELGGRSAARTLSLLTRANAFVEPVPEQAGFYRYHPFFRDLLRAELEYESPELRDSLERRAADWFAREGLIAASAGHYASIDAWTEAAHMVVDRMAVADLLLGGGSGALLRTLRPLPDDVDDPAAAVVRGAIALADGNASRLDEELTRVPPSLSQDGTRHGLAVGLAVAVLRAVAARGCEDPRESLALAEDAERALHDLDATRDGVPEPALAALVAVSKGIATARRGHLDRAGELLMAGAREATEARTEPLLVECLGHLAVLAAFEGRLTRAASLATQAVTMADGVSGSLADRLHEAHAALAWVNVERYDLRAATSHTRLAHRSHVLRDDPVPRTLLAMATSRVQAARGDVGGALARVETAAESLSLAEGWLADELRIESGHLRVAQGEPAVALLEVEGIRDREAAEVSLVVAEAQLAQGDDRAVTTSLARVLDERAPLTAQVAGWLLEASRQLRAGAPHRARTALERSLRLAAQETLRRPFREAPPAVRQLLAHDAQLVRENDWLAMTPTPRDRQGAAKRPGPGHVTLPHQRTGDEPLATPVIETLTRKELEVLEHLAELLTTEEIASDMYVSVNTIRTHVRSILRKLGVSRRNAAVRRARELHLLPS
jgi:LuxR family maltose regulon positive regulatory protein